MAIGVVERVAADRDALTLGDAEHPADLTARDLDPDPGQEPDQHGPRQEVGDEAEPDQAGDDQEHAGHQRQQPGEGDVLV